MMQARRVQTCALQETGERYAGTMYGSTRSVEKVFSWAPSLHEECLMRAYKSAQQFVVCKIVIEVKDTESDWTFMTSVCLLCAATRMKIAR